MYGDGEMTAPQPMLMTDYCREVRQTLDKSNIITFDTCLKALKSCANKLDRPESLDFINNCLVRIIIILVGESSIRIGVQTCKLVDESLSLCVAILVNLNPTPTYFLEAVGKLFNKSSTYYAGVKNYSWNTATGMAQTRINVINKFGSLSGFEIVSSILMSPDYKWVGAECSSIIVAAILELTSPLSTNDVTESIVTTIVHQVLNLSEEQLKKESHDFISQILLGTCAFYRLQSDRVKCRGFYALWKEYTLKLLNSSSLVLKLSGWDQTNELIKEASATKPPPNRYRLYNAGSEEVNGVYNMYKKEDGVYWYQKQPTTPTMPVLTLFRCVMRNKAKHWFVSILDKYKPCTPEDVDYYTFKGDAETEGEPQLTGWHRCGTISVDPPPMLEPLEPMLLDGEVEEDFLISSLPIWIEKSDIFASVFGLSIHREIVARSTRLVKFLADIKALKAPHLRCIWKAVLSNNESEVLDELLSLLAVISKALQPDLFAFLIDIVQEAFNVDANGGVSKTVLFLEKCLKEYGFRLSSCPDACISKLTGLTWNIYMSSSFGSIKNHSAVEDLLSLCLNSRTGVAVVSAYTLECMNKLLKLSQSSDETAILHVINVLCFLLGNHSNPDVLADSSFLKFPDIMVNEIERFTMHNRSSQVQGFLSDGLFKRLKLIRQYFNLSLAISISFDVLNSLFHILTMPLELEEFFRFLKTLSNKAIVSDNICDSAQADEVFKAMLCSPSLDWTMCGDTAFECFNVFFSSVVLRHTVTSDLFELGLKTLWSIMLNISSSSSAEVAIELLLRTYYDSEQLQSKFIPTMFDLFEVTAQQSLLDVNSLRHIDRLVDLMVSTASQRKGVWLAPHAAHGMFNRINVIVRYRKINQYYSYNSLSDKSDKPNEGSLMLNMDGMHTLLHLKQKIANELDFFSTKKIVIEYGGRSFTENGAFLNDLAFYDGCEVTASLHVNNFNASFYDEDETSVNDVLSVATLISSDPAKFNLLIDTAEAAQQSPFGMKAALNIWKLLNIVPTQVDFYEAVRNCNAPGFTDWLSGMQTGSLIRYTYAVQIIDAILQVSPEDMSEELLALSTWYRSAIVNVGGFSLLLAEFIRPTSTHMLGKLSKYISLHVLRYYLIESDPNEANLFDRVFSELKSHSIEVAQSLLSIACDAAAVESLSVVSSALVTIIYLLKSPEVASQLTSNPQTKDLLLGVLRSSSIRVRDIAADFAIKVGKSQSVVFSWLTSELKSIKSDEEAYGELFKSIVSLIEDNEHPLNVEDVTMLIAHVSEKMLAYRRFKGTVNQDTLCGYLSLVCSLVKVYSDRMMESAFGNILVKTIFNDFLFVFSNDNQDFGSICVDANARQTAYQILTLCMRFSKTCFVDLFHEMKRLIEFAGLLLHGAWGCTVVSDIKRTTIAYVGLKNQGGTCYMNSLLQQMYMNVSMRDAILRTKLKASHRSTLWHYTDLELVGKSFFFEHFNGKLRYGTVVKYDPATKTHKVIYPQADGNPTEEVGLKIREGRLAKETGRVQCMIPDGESIGSDKDIAARRVLEQLQRAFCFMKYSKRRFFDPKPFVDACKTLNMSFNVYHQNDAAEFYDQLLDRLETATKGEETGQNVWKDAILPSVFGGKTLYQKIPKECDIYTHGNEDCGQSKSAREEPFLKIELMIRGHEKVDEGLAELIQGELMDGDNKIMCDICAEKKAVVRRTCIGKLPNLLVLHLKRFDLDFTTFETVKLNTKMGFSNNLNMLKYTKEGFDMEERQKKMEERRIAMEAESGGKEHDAVQVEYADEYSPPDALDYEYELGGVLVHAGVAQGGHYYSFIRDTDGQPKWYRFEDDEVSSFNPDQIPYQCFGGLYPVNGSVGMNAMEEERTSNALLLFYRKVRPTVVEIPETMAPADPLLVDGYEAFIGEVRESNERHLLLSYLLDHGFQPIVREFVSVVLNREASLDAEGMRWVADASDDRLVEGAIQLSCEFVLNVALHVKERAGMQQWISLLKLAFLLHPQSAAWLVKSLALSRGWLSEYLSCADSLSRSTFGDILTAALMVVAPADSNTLKRIVKMTYPEQVKIASGDSDESIMACSTIILNNVLRSIYEPLTRFRSPDDILIIIRDLATIPSVCEAMLELDIIDDLVFFVIPDRVPEAVRRRFKTNSHIRQDQISFTIVQNVFEAIAALLGAPQKRKLNLLDESRGYWDPEFIPEAKAALHLIFSELAIDGGIDGRTFLAYYEKVNGTNSKNVALIVRNIFERFETADSKLTFNGFCKYHVELAMLNIKALWKCFYDYGFHNDLSRSSGALVASLPMTRISLSESLRRSFSDLGFYEAGINLAEGSAIAIAMRVCSNDKNMSVALIKNATGRLYDVIIDWGNSNSLDHIIVFLKMLLGIEDGLFTARVEALLGGERGIVHVLADERRFNSLYRGNVTSVAERYDLVLTTLLDAPAVRAYFDQAAETLPAFRAVSDRIVTQNRSNIAFSVAPADIVVIDTSDLSNLAIRVDGAGIDAINGNYVFREMMDQAGWFCKAGYYNNEQVTFSIYRCRMDNGMRNWFISICPDSTKPGTANDLDFYGNNSQYEAGAQFNVRLPPREGWTSCGTDAGDCPSLAYVNGEACVDTDSARDDGSNSLNVGDDDAFDDNLLFPSAPESPNEYGGNNSGSMYE